MKEQEDIKGGVVFNEGPHTYENTLGQRYLSVTQLIAKFEEKKDWREIAEKASVGRNPKYVGRSVEDILAEWNKSGDDARTRGTGFHKKKEDNHNKEAYNALDHKDKSHFIPNAKMIIPVEGTGVETDYSWLPNGEYSELILWSHKWKIAGIADKIIVDGDFFDVEDYKTNAEIHFTSFFERGKGYKKLLWPLDDIMDCSFEKYQLQLSIYAYLFSKLSGKTPRKLTILHHPTINGVVSEKETRISCTYKGGTILTLFNMWGGYAPPAFKDELKESLIKNLTEDLPDGL